MVSHLLKVAALVMIAYHPARPQTTSQPLRLRVDHDRRDLIVVDRGRRHRLSVGDKIDAAKLEDVKMLFASRLGAKNYLVVDVRGWSKTRRDDRQCGAGEEANLLWISLTSDWLVSDVQSIRYESCWAPTGGEGYEITGRQLRVKYDDFRKNLSYDVKYDADNPEEGFEITESRLKVE